MKLQILLAADNSRYEPGQQIQVITGLLNPELGQDGTGGFGQGDDFGGGGDDFDG